MILMQTSSDPIRDLDSITSGFTTFLEVVLILGGILILAYLTIRYLLPRFVTPRVAGPDLIEIVGGRYIEQRKAIYVIRVGGRYVLIGTSENGFTFLTDLSPEDIGDLPKGPVSKDHETMTFKNLLSLKRRGESPKSRIQG